VIKDGREGKSAVDRRRWAEKGWGTQFLFQKGKGSLQVGRERKMGKWFDRKGGKPLHQLNNKRKNEEITNNTRTSRKKKRWKGGEGSY